jgi:hypothetical protein
MTDLPSTLGIEAVELVSDAGRVTVRVTGRWRRRRPELRGQAMLVLEGETGRQRFPAMPEPPSLTGAAPGTWRMSFSVPAVLAAQLPGRTYLQLGGVMVPLPIAGASIAGTPAEPLDAELLEARRARSSELAAQSARRRAAELSAQVSGLERDLDDARVQSERLRAVIAERERSLRSAEQHAHAEQALRSELEQELARRTRAARHDLAALHERVAELERELIRARRAVDEAGHRAAAAEAARAEAERRLSERAAPPPPPAVPAAPAPAVPPAPAPAVPPALPESPLTAGARAAQTRRELELHRSARLRPPASAAPRPAERAGDRDMLALEARILGRRREPPDARVAALERELATAREEVEVQRRRSARAYEAIEQVRAELRQLREAGLASPPSATAPVVAAPTVPTAPGTGRPPPSGTPSGAAPQGAGEVQAERLSAALARLREQAPAPTEAPPPTEAPALGATRPWLAKAFRALARQDPSAAGRLLVALLPAQRTADPHAVAYDLVLGDVLCAHVTVTSTRAHIAIDATIRPLSEVDFQVVGDLASLARLLAAGPVRRRLRWLVPGRRMARVRGDRRRLVALEHLIGAPLGVRELQAAGVRVDPRLTMTVAGLMIEPGWTAGERFTVGHREPDAATPGAYLQVRSGKPPLPSGEPPHGPVETVVVCRADDLLGVLAGAVEGIEVVGERRPLALLAQWLERAQCG